MTHTPRRTVAAAVLASLVALNGWLPASAAPSNGATLPDASSVRVKPTPNGTISIDPASIVAGDPDVTVTADPSGALHNPRVTLTSTGAVTVDHSAHGVAANAETSVDVAATAPTGPAQITATLNGTGADGTARSASDTVWVDSVGGTPVVSAAGPLDLALKKIAVQESKGLISQAQAEAARHGAHENATVKISVNTSCFAVCLSGTVQWTDSAGNLHPVRKAPVEVWDSNVGADTLITTATTDANGFFSVTFNNSDPEGGARDPYVDVYASGPGFDIGPDTDQYGPNHAGAHFVESGVSTDVPTGSNVTANVTTNQINENNTAFSLQNAMVVAGEYIQGVRGSAFPDIFVEFPSIGGGSYYDGTSLKVDGLDRWDWDVMLHEYGHYIAAVMDIEDNPGGSHSNTNLSTTYGKSIGTRLAFGEGWPTYFAVSALSEMNTASLNIPNIGDTSYQDTEDQELTDNLETGETLGEDNENTIMSILWDLYDSAPDGRDRVALGTSFIWNLLDNSARPAVWRLSSAYVMFSPGAAATENDRNCIFSDHNVAPTITGPEQVALAAGAASPTIGWSRGNGGSFTNNQFEVQYRDATNGLLLHTSGTITALTYTASAADWGNVVSGSGGAVNVSVLGTQSSAPITGPYRSCAKQFTVPVQTYKGLVPGRLLDTRASGVTVDHVSEHGPINAAGATLQFTVAGRYNIPVNAAAVVLNVTVAGAQGNGFATVWPCGAAQPNASNLNFVAGVNVPNNVITKVGTNGKVCIYTSATTHLIADVAGYYPAGSSFSPLVPGRLLDTRASGQTVDHLSEGGPINTGGSFTEFVVGGRYGIPADASAVAVNVTVSGALGNGFATVWPCGATQPLASNINFLAGRATPNNVITKLGTAGKVCIYTSATAHLIADVAGYYPASSTYAPLVPGRLKDTRASGDTVDHTNVGGGPVAANVMVPLTVAGRYGIPVDATSVVLNVTAAGPQGSGFITVWPCGAAQPNASNVNFVTGVTIANMVITGVGTSGQVCLLSSAGTNVIVDVSGYYP